MSQKGYREPQNLETCQLPSSRSDGIPQVWSRPLPIAVSCSFCVCGATEEPSARDPWTGFLQMCALVSC